MIPTYSSCIVFAVSADVAMSKLMKSPGATVKLCVVSEDLVAELAIVHCKVVVRKFLDTVTVALPVPPGLISTPTYSDFIVPPSGIGPSENPIPLDGPRVHCSLNMRGDFAKEQSPMKSSATA